MRHPRTWSVKLRDTLVMPPLVLGADFGPRFSPRAPSGTRRAAEDPGLRFFFEQSSDPMLMLDEHHVIQDANQAATQFLECPIEALRGAPALEIDLLARLLTADGELHKARTEPVVADVSVTDSEGQPVQCRVEAIPCDACRTLLHIQNTTAVLRARSALRSAEQLHQAWFDAMSAVAWTMALPEERLLEIGPAVEPLFGHQPAEFRARPELWNELVHPADRERVRAEFRRGVASGRPFEIEFTGLHQDHRDLPHLVNRVIPVVDEGGWVGRCEGLIEDHSAQRALEGALRRSEAHLQHALETIPVGVLILEEGDGGDGARVALCSRRFARLLRLSEPLRPGTALADAPEDVLRIVAGATDAGRPRARSAAAEADENLIELRHPRRLLRRGAMPILDAFGRQTGRVIAVEDVSGPYFARRRLTHAHKMESLTRLAGGIAHDFNNLLATVSGFASLLADHTPESDPRRAAVDGILVHVERAARLTQALQAFGRVARFERIEIDLNRLIDAAYPLLRSALEPGVAIDVDLGADVPRVYGDPVLLQQLLVQLVQEAGCEAAKGTTVRIASRFVRTPPQSADGTAARVEIEIGRTPALAVRRGAGPGVEEVGGTARAVLEDIVRAHGGHIVSGAAAAPALHRITLPLRHDAALVPLVPNEDLARGGETILIVEDEADLSLVTRTGLEQRGYSVVTADSGDGALALIESGELTCDLVILDLRLPGLPGERVLEALRRIAPELPVLIASGDCSRESRSAWIAAGAQGFMPKPYRLRELATTVREILDARREAA